MVTSTTVIKSLEFMKEDCDYNVSEIRSVLASTGILNRTILEKAYLF